MTEALSAAWDRHAPFYDTHFAQLTGFIARSMVRLVTPRLRPAASLLDIACGTGAATIPALEHCLAERARTGAGGTVLATDFSPAMVERTRSAAARLDPGAECFATSVERGEALSFEDRRFDAVLSSFGIFLFEDRLGGWREAARVLRPGGVFATTVWRGPEHNAMLRAQMAPMVRAMPPRLLTPRKGGWMEVSDPASLVAELESVAAWSSVRTLPFHATFAVGDWRVLWDGLRDNPVMGALLAQCDAGELSAVRESFTEHFRALAGGDDQPLVLDSACTILVATRA